MKRSADSLPTLGDRAFELPESLRLLRPLYTVEIVDAAVRRLVLRERLPDQLSQGSRKLALLLILALNPYEDLSEIEEAIVRGIGTDKLRDAKAAGDIPRVLAGSTVALLPKHS